MTETKLKVKCHIINSSYLKMEMYELYFDSEYTGPVIDFNKEYIVVNATIDELNEKDLQKLEKQALLLYLSLLVLETKRTWSQADKAKRKLACSSFDWLEIEADAERMSTLVHQHSKSLYDVHGIMYAIWMYTE